VSSTFNLSRRKDRGLDLPSSPGLSALFETPINRRSSRDNIVVNDTPIMSRLPGPIHAKLKPLREEEEPESGERDTSGGSPGEGVSIYERLGWD